MQETDMKEKLQKIIEAYDELQAKMGDPAVLADQEGVQPPRQGVRLPRSRSPRRRPSTSPPWTILEAARESASSDADDGGFAQEEIASIEGRAAPAGGGHQVHAHPGRPGQRDRTSSWRSARRPAATRPPSSPATSTRSTSALRRGRSGWKTEPVDASPSEAGGFEAIQFKVEGRPAVYSVMKFESGVHRVQRVPKTESQGRIQTSTATVRRTSRGRRGRRPDQPVRPAHRRVPRRRPGRSVREHDRLRRAHHAPAHGSRGAVRRTRSRSCQNKIAAMAVLRARLYEKMLAEQQAAEGAERLAPDRLRRPLREDPHLQRPAGPRDRPPHRLQLHLQRGASGRQPGGRDHGFAGGRPRAEG